MRSLNCQEVGQFVTSHFDNFLTLSTSGCSYDFVGHTWNSSGNHCALCVDCCSTIIAFAQYVQEASFEEAEMFAKTMTEYRDQCLANSKLPQCSKLAVSNFFAFHK